MKPETARKLDRLIFLQRLKYGAMAAAVALGIAAFVLFVAYEEEVRVDKVVAMTKVHGTIVEARRQNGRNGTYRLTVRLDNGRSIKTVSLLKSGIPYVGEPVDLQETEHKSGRRNYAVTRLLGKP